MNHSDQLKRLLIERELAMDEFQYSSVADWASAEVSSPNPHPLAYDLFDRDCDVHATIKQIAAERFEFFPGCADGNRIVGLIVVEYLKRYINRELTPMELCKFIAIVDAYYIDCVPNDHPVLQWVSDLYNACDWCDDSWEQTILVEDAERVIQELCSE